MFTVPPEFGSLLYNSIEYMNNPDYPKFRIVSQDSHICDLTEDDLKYGYYECPVDLSTLNLDQLQDIHSFTSNFYNSAKNMPEADERDKIHKRFAWNTFVFTLDQITRQIIHRIMEGAEAEAEADDENPSPPQVEQMD